MTNQSFYINVAEPNSQTYSCFELPKEVCLQLKNSDVIQAYSKFPLKDIKENFIENYKQNKDVTIISLYYFIHLHLQYMDKELRKVVDEQKHNTFVIMIDNEDVNVFASSPQNNKSDAEQWGAFLIHTYNKTISK